jgi:hypothetical protein
MELDDAISLALAGDCLLFTGAGFAVDARNPNNKAIPTARQFARQIADKVDVDSDYSLEAICEYAIADSSDRGLGEHGLINEILSTFTIAQTSPEQDYLASLPWRRVYTTNYDLSFETAARKAGKEWTPITIDSAPNAYSQRCIHVNGHIHNLNINNLRTQFKLTHSSYAVSDFLDSPWASQLRADMGISPTIFFIGYSMADIDIARILFQSPLLRERTFFIVSEKAKPVELARLQPFGTAVPIGLRAFADLARNLPAAPAPSGHVYSWLEQYEATRSTTKPSDQDTIRLLTLGDMQPNFISAALSNPDIRYSITRSAVADALSDVRSGRTWFLVHSALGNGKTLFKVQLSEALSNIGYSVYFDTDYELGRQQDVRQLAKSTAKTAIMIDEASSRLDAIKDLRTADNGFNIFFIFVRSTIFELDRGRYEDALPESFRIIDLNHLDAIEVRDTRSLLDDLGLWGDKAAEAFTKKEEFIRVNCGGEIANLIISIFETTELGNRLKRAAQKALEQRSDVGRLIILAFLMENAETPPRLSIVSEALNLDAWKLTGQNQFADAGDFIYIRNGEIATRSSIVARFLLRNAVKPETILEYVAEFVERFDVLRKKERRIDPLFKEFQRFAFIEGLVQSPRKRELLIGFYQRLRSIPSSARNPLFWLQYAIARLSFQQYAEAELYFKSAYSFARDGQPWFERDIDNHYARLLLESRTNSDNYDDYYEAFREAHQKLYGQMLKGDNRHYPYRQARNYLAFIVSRKNKLSMSQVEMFVSSCQQVIKNIENLPHELARSMPVIECKQAMERAIEVSKGDIPFDKPSLLGRVGKQAE